MPDRVVIETIITLKRRYLITETFGPQICLTSSRQNNNDDNTRAVAVINNPYVTKHFDCFVLFVLGLQFILFHVYGATVIF